MSTPSLSNEKPIFRRPLLPGFGLSRHLLRFSSLGYLNASHRFSFSPCSAFHFGTTVLEARAGGRMDGWMEKRRSGQRSFEVEKSGSLLAWTGFMSFPRQRPSNPMTAKLQSGVLRNHFRFVLQNKSLLFFFRFLTHK